MAASKVRIEVGFVSIPARMEKATDDEDAQFRTVCLGTDTAHAAARVKTTVSCPECGRSHSSTFGYADRAVEVGDELRVVSKDDIAKAAGVPIKTMGLKFHNREKFYSATVASDSVQNITPDKGGERAFSALVEVLRARPDLVAVSIYAPRTKNALWVLDVIDNRIVASKRCWPEDVRPVASVLPVQVTETEVDLLGQFIDATVTDFDLAEYANESRAGVKALIETATGASPATVATTSNTDLLTMLQANIAKVTKPQAVRSTRKRATPRKRAAAKPAGEVA